MSSVASDNLPGERPLAAVGQDELVQYVGCGFAVHYTGDEETLISFDGDTSGQPGSLNGCRRDVLALVLLHVNHSSISVG